MYLDTTIGKPEYEFSEELTTRLGYKFLESQISNKLYKFVFLGPEFICDAMRLIRLSDYIKLESGRDSYNAISFSYEPSWETQGDLASIEVSFETDTIIQKLPSFNRNQRENFYNALLSSASEPLLYDEGVVAQYYTAFSDAITGKLTRQLAEADVEEITKSTMIPIDQGLGAAQRVSLLALFERYGGSKNAYVSGLQTAISNHVSNQDIHLVAGEREKLTMLLSFFRFDKATNAVVTPFNFISEGTIGMGGLGEGEGEENQAGGYLNSLIDVTITEPTAADVLVYDEQLQEWVNKPLWLNKGALEEYLSEQGYVKGEDIYEEQEGVKLIKKALLPKDLVTQEELYETTEGGSKLIKKALIPPLNPTRGIMIDKSTLTIGLKVNTRTFGFNEDNELELLVVDGGIIEETN